MWLVYGSLSSVISYRMDVMLWKVLLLFVNLLNLSPFFLLLLLELAGGESREDLRGRKGVFLSSWVLLMYC